MASSRNLTLNFSGGKISHLTACREMFALRDLFRIAQRAEMIAVFSHNERAEYPPLPVSELDTIMYSELKLVSRRFSDLLVRGQLAMSAVMLDERALSKGRLDPVFLEPFAETTVEELVRTNSL